MTDGTGRPTTNETAGGARKGRTPCPPMKRNRTLLRNPGVAVSLETAPLPRLPLLHLHHLGSPPDPPGQSDGWRTTLKQRMVI